MRTLLAVACLCAARFACAATLEVGDGKAFARPEQALAQARAGDEIVVSPRSGGQAYTKVALLVRTPRLTIRSADPRQPVKIDGAGYNYSGRGSVPRAIAQFDPAASGCVLEGFELYGARNESFNGAGVRINAANDVTIRNCRIHDNDMGIMSNGRGQDKSGAGQLIEGCTITSNGTDKEPGYNHNLYLGGTSVTVRGCEVAFSTTGHNLKSRAHFNWIEYNYIHDSANRELDLVDEAGNTDVAGSDAVLLGNIITKRMPRMEGNKTVVHFGKDGGASHNGRVYLVHNTITTPYISPVLDLSSGSGGSLINNVIEDGGTKVIGTLVAVRDGVAMTDVSGDGNVLGASFHANAPAQVRTGSPVKWDAIELPWPDGKRQPLMVYRKAGEVVPRVQSDANAGAK